MNKEKLIMAGIDYDEGVERFAGKSQIYEKYLLKFFNGDMFQRLEGQLAEKDYQNAFRTVHDLKGAAGNLSLKFLYSKICDMTELLRNAKEEVEYIMCLSL